MPRRAAVAMPDAGSATSAGTAAAKTMRMTPAPTAQTPTSRALLRSGERHNVAFMTALLAGLVEPRFLGLPEKVAEDAVVSFLSFRDAMVLRVASMQLCALVEASLARREVVDLSHVNASETGIAALLGMCPAARSVSLRENAFVGVGFAHALAPELRVLEITNCPGLKVTEAADPPLAQIVAHCRRLEVVSSNAFCDRSLRALAAASGPSLREVSCRESGHHVTGAGVLALVQSSPRLRALDLSWCALGDEHFQTLANVPSVRERLEMLDISGCCDVRDPARQRRLFRLTEEGVALGVMRMHALREFACHGLFPEAALFAALEEHRGFPLDMAPDACRAAGARLVRAPFTALRLGDCPRLDSAGRLRRFAAAVGANLRTLELKGCKEISDIGGLCEVAKACPRLEELCLNGCAGASDLFMQTLAQSCPNLRKAAFRRVERLSDVGVAALVDGCPGLRYLDLSGCLGITDCSLLHLMQCTNLQTLLLYCCSAITDRGFLHVLGIEPAAIELDEAPQPGAEEALAEAVTAAATLSLFTDRSAVKRPVAWPLLEHLDLSWCFHISAPCFLAIMQRLPHLRKLSIEGFDHFTSKDLARIQCFGPRVVIEASHHDDDAIERHIQHLHRLHAVDDKRYQAGPRARARSADAPGGDHALLLSSGIGAARKGLRRKGSSPSDFAHHITLYQPVPPAASPRARGRSRAGSLSRTSPPPFDIFPVPTIPVVDTDLRCELDEDARSSPTRGGPNGAHMVRRVSLEDLEAMETPSLPQDPPQSRPRAYSEALTGVSSPKHRSDAPRAGAGGSDCKIAPTDPCRRRFGDDQQDLSRLSAFAAAK